MGVGGWGARAQTNRSVEVGNAVSSPFPLSTTGGEGGGGKGPSIPSGISQPAPHQLRHRTGGWVGLGQGFTPARDCRPVYPSLRCTGPTSCAVHFQSQADRNSPLDPTVAQVSGRRRHCAGVCGQAHTGAWGRECAPEWGGVQESGALGSVSVWCPRPRWGGWGSLALSPPGEIRARATQPPGHGDMLLGPTAAHC